MGMEKFKHRKLLMPSHFSYQLDFIKNDKTDNEGGWFAGTSENKYYAKKQHRNYINKWFTRKATIQEDFSIIYIN